MIKYSIVKYLGLCLALIVAPVFAQTSQIPLIQTPESPPVAPAAAEVLVKKNEAVETPESQAPVLPVATVEIKSLLFSDDDIAAMRSARLFYDKNHGGAVGKFSEDDFLKKLEKVAPVKTEPSVAPTSFTYPQFFLSSIAYYSPDDWVVWINGEKLAPNSGVSVSGLRVLEIDGEKVTIEWLPEKMDKIADSGDYSAENPVKVDFTGNKVVFSLKANQTFTSYAMKVVEGKLMPVTINVRDGTRSSEEISAK